jgi:hypothetical protein
MGKRILAGGLAVVSSGVGLPYAWQGLQSVSHFFSGLRDDVSSLKLDQAQLKGQVTQIQSDLQVIIGREVHGMAQRGIPDELPAHQRKEGAQ